MHERSRPPGSARARRSVRLAAALLAVALGAAACGGDDDTPAAAESDGPVLETTIFEGQATTVGGETFDLGTLANADLVVWFWAPW